MCFWGDLGEDEGVKHPILGWPWGRPGLQSTEIRDRGRAWLAEGVGWAQGASVGLAWLWTPGDRRAGGNGPGGRGSRSLAPEGG